MVQIRLRNAECVAPENNETVDTQEIAARIGAIFEHEHRADYDDEFWYYNRSIRSKRRLRNLIREIVDNFALAGFNPAGKAVLDAGCGYGLRSLIISQLGAAEVHALDILPHRIETLQRILQLFPHIGSVDAQLGDVSRTGFPQSSVDLVFCNEAISHYPDIPAFLQEVARLLKPGGTLFISDGNNGANPLQVVQSRRLWRRFEEGPPGVVGRHTITTPLRTLRQGIIRAYAPDLSEKQVHLLVLGTFQYRTSEIHAAVNEYRTTGHLPTSTFRADAVPMWPDRGYVIERLAEPWKLLRQFRDVGLTGRVYANVGGSNGQPMIRAVNRMVQLLGPVTWPIARTLKIVAQKQVS